MRTETPPEVRLSEYQPYPFALTKVKLSFELHPSATRVTSQLSVRRTGASHEPLRLNGEKLKLLRIAVNGRDLQAHEYEVDEEFLTLNTAEDAFELDIETEISPESNSELSGLYLSGGRFCTQCEAEGFRRITYYPDRPDVLAPFEVRIEADKAACPYLLSNGNPIASGDLPGGRHFALWNDPFPKPSYLFALVGGDFDTHRDSFTTKSGRPVKLVIYVEKGDAERAAFAMASLKLAMAWDEDVFGREYDLDIFQIVAVRDFNFGAMENKGLNIFNSAYVLADSDTATDADFEAIESIVAHEYFHNWTGNRITCRDWFQLCLKEGLTVFRDQEFTQSVRSAAVGRIKEVIRLRARQFVEDAGPLAHQVRPDAYARIDNLYTATVYEKGAEIIRMLRLLIGEKAFFAGVNRYFDDNDGRAATIEDFIDSFRGSTSADLDGFSLWYSQAGTPQVRAAGEYDAVSKTYVLTLSQSTPPTPRQASKRPMHIPMRAALFDDNGAKLDAVYQGRRAQDHTILLSNTETRFAFQDVASPPIPSLNRGFSAPIQLEDRLGEGALARLAAVDDDPFAKWEALQKLARSLILDQAAGLRMKEADERRTAFSDAVAVSVEKAIDGDPAFAALLLHVPTVNELMLGLSNVDTDALYEARHRLRQAMATRMEPFLAETTRAAIADPKDLGATAVGRRSLKSNAMSLLATLGGAHEADIEKAFSTAPTMTLQLSSLSALAGIESGAFDQALAAFERRWNSSPLIMDKWYSVQAGAKRADIRRRLFSLLQRQDFEWRNPNRVRALAAAFSINNPVSFHAPDGWGYQLLADIILKVDPQNSALSARLATGFETWRQFEPVRRQAALVELKRLSAADLSKNTRDIVSRALGEETPVS